MAKTITVTLHCDARPLLRVLARAQKHIRKLRAEARKAAREMAALKGK